MVRQASVEIGGTPPKGETKVRRAFCSPDKLVERPADGVNTMVDVLAHSMNSEFSAYSIPPFSSLYGCSAAVSLCKDMVEVRGQEKSDLLKCRSSLIHGVKESNHSTVQTV